MQYGYFGSEITGDSSLSEKLRTDDISQRKAVVPSNLLKCP
jgi:hypothetical protein